MRYNRFGFQSNKHNSGSAVPFPSPNLSVSQTTNSTAVTYTITSDITYLSNLAYSITGTAVGSDFIDGATSGNIALTSGNGVLVKQVVSGNPTEPTFAVQLKASATDGAFYTGNTFQVTTVQEPAAVFANGNNPIGTANVGGQLYTVVHPNGSNSSFTFSTLGSNTDAIIEVLVVGGGGGSGAKKRNIYNTSYIPSGGGGGGESVIQNIAANTLSTSTTYTYSIGAGGVDPVNSDPVSPTPTQFQGTPGGDTTVFSITAAGGSFGNSDTSSTSDSFGAGGTGNGHTAGSDGGAGGQSTNLVGIGPANDGQNGGAGTSYYGWITNFPLDGTATIGTVQAGAGGGGAKAIFEANAGAAGGSSTTTNTVPGLGGTAFGQKEINSNAYWEVIGGHGNEGIWQMRWKKVAGARTIAIT